MKDLLKAGRKNSVLLTLCFGINTYLAAISGSILFSIFGIIATASAIIDVTKFNKAIKENENVTR